MYSLSQPHFVNNRQALLFASIVFIVGTIFCRFLILESDPTLFIYLTEDRIIQEELPIEVRTQKGPYDGIAFFRYALNPFSKDKKYDAGRGDMGVIVNNPDYRRRRVVYPLTAWALAFGKPEWVPYSLILVNVLAFMGLIWVSLSICRFYDLPPIYGLFPLLIVGFFFSTARDLSDLLACFFLGLALFSYLKNNLTAFIIASVLALFTKETAAFFLLPIFAILGLAVLKQEGKKKWLKLLALGVPWILLLIWILFLQDLYSVDTNVKLPHRLSRHFTFPFYGMWKGGQHFLSTYGLIRFLSFWFLNVVWILFFLFISLRSLSVNREKLSPLMRITSLISVGLILTFASPIYIDPWSFTRVTAPAILFLYFALLDSKSKVPTILWIGGWVTFALDFFHIVT